MSEEPQPQKRQRREPTPSSDSEEFSSEEEEEPPPTRRAISPPRIQNQWLPPIPHVPQDWDGFYQTAKASHLCLFKDCQDLSRLLPALTTIHNLIGLKSVKDALVDSLMFYCQRHKVPPTQAMNHVLITGPPGCGKTTLAQALAVLYKHMGFIATDRVVVGTRQNMIGAYIGHTERNTQTVIDSAMGGVLLIDEAYSLGDGRSSQDSFSKVCIDTINRNLSEHAGDFVCILVGYKEAIRRDLFSVNPGLERRFPWVYDITPYTYQELDQMFRQLCCSRGLPLDLLSTLDFFKRHYRSFRYHAASVVEFVTKLQLVLCRSSFGRSDSPRGPTLSELEQTLLLLPKDQVDHAYLDMYS